eukprot:sb/3465701/
MSYFGKQSAPVANSSKRLRNHSARANLSKSRMIMISPYNRTRLGDIDTWCGNRTRCLCHQEQAVLCGTAVVLTVIGDCFSDWTAVEREVKIPWDLEATPLQIKTDSTLGSGDMIRVKVYDKDSNYITSAGVVFSSTMKYGISHCTNNWADLPVQSPVEVDKIWTFSKTRPPSSSYVIMWRWGESDVEEIRFKDVTDTASDFYRGAPPVLSCQANALTTVLTRSDNWTAVQRGVRIPWDLEGTSLQIKTDSTQDSNDVIMIDMYDYESTTTYIGNVRVMITSPNVMYYLIHCAAWDVLPVQPPVEVEKIWTFTKTETALIITCNDVIVLNYLFADSANGDCVPRWGGDVRISSLPAPQTVTQHLTSTEQVHRPGRLPAL